MKTRALVVTTLLAALGGPLKAATVADVLAEIDRGITADQREEPGNTARATALAAALASDRGLPPADLIELRLACAGAWLEAGRLAETRTLLTPLLQDAATPAALRVRAGLMWVAAWQLEWKAVDKPADFPAVAVSLAKFPELGPLVAARCATAEAERLLAIDPSPAGVEPALGLYDKALALLAGEAPEQRVPVYALRVAAMERAGDHGAAIHGWLQAHAADPAAARALETAMTASDKQLGARAPALRMPRLDGVPGTIDLADHAGKPVLIDFFATWCKPCAAVAPTVAAAARRLKDQGVAVLGVSLDSPDTVKDLPTWIARYGIDYPIIGEQAGFQGPMTSAWQVGAIPALILVGPDGTVVANDLLGGSAEQTQANLDAALKRLPPAKPRISPVPTDQVP